MGQTKKSSTTIGHDGRAVANFVLDYCDSNSRKISNLALQKILYFAHVWCLVDLERPLIKHKFEAWEYGPVLPYVYREFRQFEASPINRRAQQLDASTGEYKVARVDLDHMTEQLLIRAIDFHSRMSPSTLVELAHIKGGPWHEVWEHRERLNPGMQISNELIQQFYSRTVGHLPTQ